MKITEESLKSVYLKKTPEELLELHQSGKLSELAYTAIEDVMKQHSIEIPCRPEENYDIESDDQLKKYWSGSKTLNSAFWVISIAGSLAVIFFAYALANLFKMPHTKQSIYSAITFPYLIFLTMILWRTSKNKSGRLFKSIGLMTLTVTITTPIYLYGFIAINN